MKIITNFKDTSNIIISGFCFGWKKPLSEIQLKELLIKSTYNVVAVDDGRIVGIITALSDTVNWAFIPYLEVMEGYKNKGIGSTLLKEMLKQLESITCVDLTCDEELQPFYEKFGMLRSSGMVLRKYA